MKPNPYVTTIVLTAAVTGLAAWYLMRGTVAENEAQAASRPKPVTQSAPKPPKINFPPAEKAPRQLNAWGDFVFDEKEHEAMIKKWRAGELLPGEWHTHWAKLARADAANAIMLYAQLKLDDRQAEKDFSTVDILSKECGKQLGDKGADLLIDTFSGLRLQRMLNGYALEMPFNGISLASFISKTRDIMDTENLMSSIVFHSVSEDRIGLDEIKSCVQEIRDSGGNDAMAISLLTAAIVSMPGDKFKFEDKMSIFSSEVSKSQIPEPVLSRWILSISKKEPEKTFHYVQDNGMSIGLNNDLYSGLSRDAISGWTLQRPNDAATWLSQNRNAANYDALAAGLVASIRVLDPTAADAWLATIKDERYIDWATRTTHGLGRSPSGERIPLPDELFRH